MNAARFVIAGILTMGYLVAALFFLRFWRRTHDRLFMCFAGAFALLAVQRVALVIAADWMEDAPWLYLIRLTAFVLIVFAIVSKNTKRS
jgi:peptidoglycan/LPS O-acetylase OafA/YrhL